MPPAWLQRKDLQPCEGPPLEQFAVDAGRTPERVGYAHIPNQLTDVPRNSRPPPRRRDLQRQNDRNPARCQRTTVSGRTMASASTIPGTRRYIPTNINLSSGLKANLFEELRRSTLIC